MELIRILTIAAVVLIAAAAPVSGGGTGAVVVTGNDDGKEISLPRGGIIEVRLEAAGATGYLWEVVDLDKTRLELLGSSTKPLSERPLMGGPVLTTWRFKAVATGRTQLKMLLYRPWEGPDKAAEKFQIGLRIE